MSDSWNPSREEVIEGLKKVWDAFDHMEHDLYADYVFDALKMLKDQEPRVLTLEEVKKLQYIRDGAIWLELFCNGLFPTFPEFSNKSLTFFVAILFDGYRSVFENDWYGKTWRCWSSRPTDEQREATPWQS